MPKIIKKNARDLQGAFRLGFGLVFINRVKRFAELSPAFRKRRSDVNFDCILWRAPGQKYAFCLGETRFLDKVASVSRRVGIFWRFGAFNLR
jgi:hypothetical protein